MQKIKTNHLYFLKFFAFSIIVLEILSGIVSAAFVYRNSSEISDNIISTNNALLDSISTQIDNCLNQYRLQLENSTIQKNLYNITDNKANYSRFKYETSLRNILESLAFSNVGITSISFHDTKGSVIGYNMDYERSMDIYAYLKSQKDSLSGKSRIYSFADSSGSNLFLFKRMYYVDEAYKIHLLGDMIVQLHSETILGKCFDFESINTSIFYSCDSNGYIIASNKKDDIGLNLYDKYTKNENEELELKGSHEKYVVTVKEFNDYNVINMSLYSKKEIIKTSLQPMLYILFLVIICTLVTIFIIFLFISVNKRDRKNYILEIKIKETQISAYESQINPHFLYNALQMIQMLGVSKNYEGVQDATVYLGEVLRYSLEAKKEVLIYEEIENIEYYFSLVKLRYRERFEYSIEIQEDIKNCKMLKFILQPVIENAIKHGIEKVDRICEVKILGKKFANQIVLIVRDNGLGMNEEKLEEVQGVLSGKISPSDVGCGIGLKNVSERIKLFYGEDYGIEIISKYDEKTDVMINIPIDENTGDFRYV